VALGQAKVGGKGAFSLRRVSFSPISPSQAVAVTMFKKLFGGSKDSAPPVQASSFVANRTIESIQALTDQEENLDKRKALLERKMEAEVEKARVFMKAQKKAQALQCMKRKKLIEAEVEKVEQMIMRIMEQKSMLEGQATTVDVLKVMKNAAKIQTDQIKQMNVGEVDKVMDDINEANQQMSQIHDAMGQPMGTGFDIDEDELLGELEEMAAADMDKELLAPAQVPTTKVPAAAAAASHQAMPTAPVNKPKPVVAKTQDELDLEELQAEMMAS